MFGLSSRAKRSLGQSAGAPGLSQKQIAEEANRRYEEEQAELEAKRRRPSTLFPQSPSQRALYELTNNKPRTHRGHNRFLDQPDDANPYLASMELGREAGQRVTMQPDGASRLSKMDELEELYESGQIDEDERRILQKFIDRKMATADGK